MKLAENLRRAVLQAAIEGKLTGGSQENWRFVRLGDVGEIMGGGTPDTSKSEYWVHGRIAWITPADMGTLKSKYISHGARNITEKGLASSSARIMPKGSIIFSSRAPIGYIAIAENDLCTNQGCKSVKLYDGVLSEYVYFALLATRDDIKKMGSGTTFKEISGRVFSSVIIPLPPIDEQRRIVSRLDAILPLITELEVAENELEALERRFPGDMRDSLLQAAIEGKLTGSNTGIWQRVRLGDVVHVISGTSYEKHDVCGKGVRVIRGGNLVGEKIVLKDDDVFLPCKYANEEKQVQQNDIVIIASTGSLKGIGRAAFVNTKFDEPIQIGAFLRIVRPVDSSLAYYLKVIFAGHYYRNYISQVVNGIGIKNIREKHITELVIPLPSLAEQKQIVSRLNELLPLCEAMKGE